MPNDEGPPTEGRGKTGSAHPALHSQRDRSEGGGNGLHLFSLPVTLSPGSWTEGTISVQQTAMRKGLPHSGHSTKAGMAGIRTEVVQEVLESGIRAECKGPCVPFQDFELGPECEGGSVQA